MVAKAMVDSDMLWGWLDSYYEIADVVGRHGIPVVLLEQAVSWAHAVARGRDEA